MVIKILFEKLIFYPLGRKKTKKMFSVIWKKSSSIKPIKILGERPFDEYYYQRPINDLIQERLKNKNNILIIGPPLSGKSRTVYHALRNSLKPSSVLIPFCMDINPESFQFPWNLKFWRPNIIVLDDLHRFAEQRNFDFLFRCSLDKNFIILATCRSEIELKKAKKILAEKNIYLETIFGENIFQLEKIDQKTGREIAEKIGKRWDQIRFDGTVGSIFMPLSEMVIRFDQCSQKEKMILRTIRNLYICGAYKEKQNFPLKWIKIVAGKEGLKGKGIQWMGWLESLVDKEFIKRKENEVWMEEVYLDDVIKPELDIQEISVFKKILSFLPSEPEVLVRLGNRACEQGVIRIEKAGYMKLAIKAYEEALRVRTLDRFPMDYGMTQNNLGAAYSTLAEVEAKAENCKSAIKAYEEALRVYTLDSFPMDYGMTQNNLGTAYRALAEVEAKAENCKRAIKAHEEAVKVFEEQGLSEYAQTVRVNLGTIKSISKKS